MAPTTEPKDLLSPFIRNPWSLLTTLSLPQIVLFFLNLRTAWLVAGEMTPEQSTAAWWLGVAGALLFLVGTVATCTAGVRGRRMDLRAGLALVFLHVAYLWIFTARLEEIIPSSVPEWMLPRGGVLYAQFALIMPALLHGTLLIAGFRSHRSAGAQIGLSFGLLIGIPLIAYILTQVISAFMRHTFVESSIWIVILLFFAGMTTLLVIFLLRALLLLGGLLMKWGHGRMVWVSLIGLVGPVAGLLLNRQIPFPANFQSAAVYALAIINGVLLLIPVTGPRAAHRIAWLMQCALFTFTAYFTLVFLPFIPLALLAVVAMGSGLLMLVPLALFVVHAQQLASGWRASSRGWRVAGVLAVCSLPALFNERAQGDRIALDTALNHLHSPDYRAGSLSLNREALRRGLENLRDAKAGIQLPFLSDYYRHIVFGGLVLPDEKLKTLYQAFFGSPLPDANPSSFGMNLFGEPSPSSRFRSVRPSTNQVRLISLDTTRAEESDCETATAKLVIRNESSETREFVAQLHVPPGVFISGYWLHIGNERVPGRIFERKTALWMYEMIRDVTQRDPGILVFRDPTTVELRVFPLAGGEKRTTEVEFIWPRGLRPAIRIADRELDTTSPAPTPGPVFVQGETGVWCVVSAAARASAPVDPHPPYLHLILDASEGADPAAMAKRAREVAATMPGVSDVMISTANYEMNSITPSPVSLDQLEAVIRGIQVPLRGGFCRDRALKQALIWRSEHAPDRGVVPVILLAGGTNTVVQDDDIAYFAAFHPDVPGYLEVSDGPPVALDFKRHPLTNLLMQTVRIDAGDRSMRLPLAGDRAVACWLPTTADGVMEVTNARYRAAAQAWSRYADWVNNPAGREELRSRIVEQSRAASVLTPLTSFIVVENSAQWRMMEQKEKQKLRQSDALEIQKAPEPSVWLLAAGLVLWLAVRRALHNRSPIARLSNRIVHTRIIDRRSE